MPLTPGRSTDVGLPEAAEQLGVHYMTAYRYVRTGRLRATRAQGRWLVPASEIARLTRTARGRPGPRSTAAVSRATVRQLGARLVAGDEPGAWAILESALVSGRSPVQAVTGVLSPSLALVGEQWAAGRWTIADEHRATVVAGRLVGRLGPLLTRRGRSRGMVLLACVPGEQHALPAALLAAVLRGHGYEVVELGADTPAEEIVNIARRHPELLAIGLSASTTSARQSAAAAVAQVRAGLDDAFVLLGGGGVEAHAQAVTAGADDWAADADGVVSILDGRRQPRRVGHAAAARPARSPAGGSPRR